MTKKGTMSKIIYVILALMLSNSALAGEENNNVPSNEGSIFEAILDLFPTIQGGGDGLFPGDKD